MDSWRQELRFKIVASLRRAFTIGTGPCFVWGTWENGVCSVNAAA